MNHKLLEKVFVLIVFFIAMMGTVNHIEAVAWNNLGVINLNHWGAEEDRRFLDRAEKMFVHTQNTSSQDLATLRGLGLVFFEKKEVKDVVDLWQDSPLLAIEASDRCRLHYVNSETETALSWCEIAAKLNPNEADTWYLLGIIRMQDELWQEALDAFLRTISLKNLSVSGMSNPYLRTGIIYQWRLSQLDNALTAYNQAIAINEFGQPSEAAETYYRHGEVLMWQNYSPDVYLKDFQTAVSLDPKNVQARIMLAITQYQLDGNLPAAEEEIRRALETDPANAAIYLKLGDIYILAGKIAEAEKAFQTAIALDPNLQIDISSRQKSLSDN